jgi:Cytochrome c7 and related cytochrome c
VPRDGPLRVAAERLDSEPIPHPSAEGAKGPEAVFAVLLARYLRFAVEHPGAFGDRPADGPRHPLPSRRELTPTQAAVAASEWAEKQSREAGRTLLLQPGQCLLCHQADLGRGGLATLPPVYLASNIPARWFPHSVFSHGRHGAFACVECHAGAESSPDASRVAMPKLADCLKCHNGRAQGARVDCIECHVYHGPRGAGSLARLTVEKYLQGHDAGSSPTSSARRSGVDAKD